jgi:hypothetical protein
LEATIVMRDIARAELQIAADSADIAFDRQTARAGEFREVVTPYARDLHHALRNTALHLNTPSDECGIDAVEPQAAYSQAVAIAFKWSGNPRCSVTDLLDEA